MAEEAGRPSRYVKLTRDQDAPRGRGHPPRRAQPARRRPAAGGEEVQRVRSGAAGVLPGARRRAVDHRRLRMHRRPRELLIGLFCPCVLFGRNVQALREDIPWTTPCTCHAVFVEVGIALAILTAIFHGVDPRTSFLIGEGLVFSWWICSTCTGIFCQELQRKYHLKNSPCDPFLAHCCLHWCANCQEHRERKGRLTDNSAVPMTIVNPPPVQEMRGR